MVKRADYFFTSPTKCTILHSATINDSIKRDMTEIRNMYPLQTVEMYPSFQVFPAEGWRECWSCLVLSCIWFWRSSFPSSNIFTQTLKLENIAKMARSWWWVVCATCLRWACLAPTLLSRKMAVVLSTWTFGKAVGVEMPNDRLLWLSWWQRGCKNHASKLDIYEVQHDFQGDARSSNTELVGTGKVVMEEFQDCHKEQEVLVKQDLSIWMGHGDWSKFQCTMFSKLPGAYCIPGPLHQKCWQMMDRGYL